MELKIYSPTEEGFLKSIEWNHEEIKREVAERVRYYKNLAYTDDQIADAKKDRATLNKFVQELEATRKAVKKQCLAPYEDFEKKIKEIVQIVNEPREEESNREIICGYWFSAVCHARYDLG